MDSFGFQDELLEGATLNYSSFSPGPPFDTVTAISDNDFPMIALTSAFERYFKPLNVVRKCDDTPNVHRRVIDMLRSIWKSKPNPQICRIDDGCSREFRHMMRERHRREKLSQSYSELYSILAPRSKADKNSIVQSAAAYVQELKIIREELHRQNKKLRERIDTENILRSKGLDLRYEYEMLDNNIKIEEAKIEAPLMNEVSTIDTMIEALQCMKGMGVRARSIKSEFFAYEFTTVMAISTKVEKSEVERGMEMERKLRLQLQRRGVWAPTKVAATPITSPCGELRSVLDAAFEF